MNPEAITAWIALYIAAGSTALLCAILATGRTVLQLKTGSWRPSLTTKADYLIAVPKVWLRWQINYLHGAPAILAIAIFFAYELGFDVLWRIEIQAR